MYDIDIDVAFYRTYKGHLLAMNPATGMLIHIYFEETFLVTVASFHAACLEVDERVAQNA